MLGLSTPVFICRMVSSDARFEICYKVLIGSNTLSATIRGYPLCLPGSSTLDTPLLH